MGKEYEQDEELEWGCLVDREYDDKMEFKETRSTYKKEKQITMKIHEVIITTCDRDCNHHIAPMGINIIDNDDNQTFKAL